MSPDTIFAAQMWNWPDAVIKRNAQGQVLLVNSAFLSMYGGTVEAWAGHLVTGWSLPPAPGTAVRFETRTPGPTNASGAASELVFDWIESAAPDGSSLAIARNVTHIQPQPAQPEIPQFIPEAKPDAAVPAFVAAASQAPAAPAFEPVMEAAPQPVAAQYEAPEPPVWSEPQAAQPVAAATPAEQPEPVAQPAESFAPVIGNSSSDASHSPAMQAPVAAAPAIDTADDHHFRDILSAPVELAEPVLQNRGEQGGGEHDRGEREFERRALPMEDESAVLGNNWRDAVIAKAVGATGAQAPEEPPAEPQPEPAAPSDTVRILLAEDNAINALLTRTLLEAEGCIVDTVEDGALAVEAMKVKTYDLIFMDMRMPNMDGLEATRKIRTMDHRSKGLPIVALTANAFDDDRNACFDAGMNDFMTKPVSAEELSEMVAAWTGESAKEKLARMA